MVGLIPPSHSTESSELLIAHMAGNSPDPQGTNRTAPESALWFDLTLLECKQTAEDEVAHADRHFDYSDASVEPYVMVGEPGQVTVREPK